MIGFHVPRVNSRKQINFVPYESKTNLMLKSPLNFLINIGNKLSNDCDINFSSLQEILPHSKL